MSESADSTVELRLQRNTYFVILALLLGGALWSGGRMVLGVALGGGLCLLNKNWLHNSLRAILKIAAENQDGRVPPFTTGKFIFRYYLIACVIGAAVWTGWFHPLGIGLGFAAFVGSVMLEAGYQLYLAYSSHQPSSEE